ncbi:hypothetical protein KCP77_16810 [Salmonella enterica subsp. enterica]|nr:hypothetical protein KCP77_16810 [Salmonella enterica subsp. enterica]
MTTSCGHGDALPGMNRWPHSSSPTSRLSSAQRGAELSVAALFHTETQRSIRGNGTGIAATLRRSYLYQ